MPDPDVVQAADERYAAQLAEQATDDVRPACRQLLLQLRATAPEQYEAAVRRYEERLVPAIAAGEVGAVDAWISYGGWLADQLYDGRLVSIDASGRSSALEGELPVGCMALYLPAKDDRPAILLASPLAPSEHQSATRELLCR